MIKKEKFKNIIMVLHKLKKINFQKRYLFIYLFFIISIAPSVNGLFIDCDIAGYADLTRTAFEGDGLYSSEWHNKPVGIHLIFQFAFLLMGKSFFSIQILGVLTYFFTSLVILKITKLISGSIQATITLIIFIIFVCSGLYRSYSYNTESFLILFSTLGIYFYLLFEKNKKFSYFFISAFVFGLGFLIKQIAIFPFLLVITYTFIKNYSFTNIKLRISHICIGIFLFLFPFILTLFYLYLIGKLELALYDMFIFNFKHMVIGHSSLSESFKLFFSKLYFYFLKEISFLLLIFILPSILTCFKINKTHLRLIVLWLFFELISISTSGWYFEHYFILILPPLSILIGIGIVSLFNFLIKYKNKLFTLLSERGNNYINFFTICSLFFIAANKPILNSINNTSHFLTLIYKTLIIRNQGLTMSFFKDIVRVRENVFWTTYPRHVYTYHQVAQVLKKHLSREDKIYIWDETCGESIYFWTGHLNQTSFRSKRPLLTYDLSNNYSRGKFKKVEEKKKILLKELKKLEPLFIIVSHDRTPYGLSEELNSFPEFLNLLNKKYRLVKTFNFLDIYKKQ